jgi:DNA repair exonuclease SbcCD nuclease subunit
MRGQVFDDVDGVSLFAFGGARSQDIQGGILDIHDPDFKAKQRFLESIRRPYRIDRVSWWREEMATEEEMKEGRENLASHKNSVDFIITHCCASSTQALLSGGQYRPDAMTTYLEEIRQTVKFKHWFFGHYHEDRSINAKEHLLFEQIVRIH